QYHASAVGGVEVPSGATTTEPTLTPGGTDYLVGATISRDGRRYYLWTSGVARMNGGLFAGSRSNAYRYDAAVGWRPWLSGYEGVDPLLLLEFNGVTVEQSADGHPESPTSTAWLEGLQPRADVGAGGGAGAAGTRTILALSPSFWLTYRNFALKGGVKLPVYQDVGGGMKLDYALVTEFEIHM
ncbi:MAG: hypothetical protein ABEJ00_00825, partial [Gemmatimonadota bacterium]